MILTAHQPAYLPWLGLFEKIALSDTFVSFNQVQYQPKSWNSRNQIKINNNAHYLTVPVLKKNYLNKKITDIEINNNLPWARKHLGSIHQAYRKSLYFSRYIGFFEDVYGSEWQYLSDLNEHMLVWFLDVLGLEINFINAKEWNFKGEKSDLVLDMCKQIGADVYIFGCNGKDYADGSSFRDNNIDVIFQEYKHPEYPQLGDAFLSHLSVIDLLFNCGEDSLDIILNNK